MKNRVAVFLEDMTYNTRFDFLEEGKDKDELVEIAKKRGMRLPSHDLSVFKGRYAYVDRMNLNNCTLPREEVEMALDTLNGKAIDFDHYRKNVVGHWLDAKIEGDEIIAYGAFFKSNFQEDYQTIRELMEEDVLAISFEAWGDRDMKEDGTYDLRDIEFAGGALLIKTKPAFPGSEVLEMSNKNNNRVLELAKVLTPPEDFIHQGAIFSSKDKEVNDNKDHFPIKTLEQAKNALERVDEYTTAPKWYNGSLSEVQEKVKKRIGEVYPSLKVAEPIPEIARYYLHDLESIMRTVAEVDCLSCKEKGYSQMDNIDFKNNRAKIKCLNCETEMAVDLTPMSTITKKGRKLKQISTINHDSARAAAGEITDNVATETVKEEKQSMKTLMDKYKVDSVEKLVQTIAKATLGRELSEDELSFAYTVVEYKAGGGAVNSTSLMSLKGKARPNPVSLVAASISEDDIKAIISEIAEKVDLSAEETPEETPAPAEETPTEDAPAEETPAETPAEETPSEAPAEEPVAEEPEAPAETPEATPDATAAQLKAKDEQIALLKARIEKFEKAEREAKEKAKAKTVKARRDELGEYVKDMSDEELFDDDKYTIAKQNKVIDELKKGSEVEPDLSKGSIDKGELNVEAETRKRIQKLAWSDKDEE